MWPTNPKANSNNNEQAIKKRENFIRTKQKIVELLCFINLHIRRWMLDNFLSDEGEAWGNKDVVLQKDKEKNMNEAYERDLQWINFKNKKEMYCVVYETDEIPSYNERNFAVWWNMNIVKGKIQCYKDLKSKPDKWKKKRTCSSYPFSWLVEFGMISYAVRIRKS